MAKFYRTSDASLLKPALAESKISRRRVAASSPRSAGSNTIPKCRPVPARTATGRTSSARSKSIRRSSRRPPTRFINYGVFDLGFDFQRPPLTETSPRSSASITTQTTIFASGGLSAFDPGSGLRSADRLRIHGNEASMPRVLRWSITICSAASGRHPTRHCPSTCSAAILSTGISRLNFAWTSQRWMPTGSRSSFPIAPPSRAIMGRST